MNYKFLASILYLAIAIFALPQSTFSQFATATDIVVGAERVDQYLPNLKGKRVAILANHTAMVGDEHLVDMLHGKGVDIVGIFAPEHGFRGGADAGEKVSNSVDEKTGIKILSLYNGNAKRPTDSAISSFDVLVVDMQDVGLRFYTYYISAIRMVEACADFGKDVVILDRPNPNGDLVDGPILDMKHKSGVGWLPVPVLHGLTLGELVTMAAGQKWCKAGEIEVVRCLNYNRDDFYELPVAPSPNLKSQKSIYLYATLCLFEGSVLSVGRGTDRPFEIYGHPALKGSGFSFTPQSMDGAKSPIFENQVCYGVDMGNSELDWLATRRLNLDFIVDAYNELKMGNKFFKPIFEKLIGVSYVREMIMRGCSAHEIESMWIDDVANFKELRREYLLYTE